ncbi:hypothetical protein [Okeania sp. KiyG1]|uniref:hypothetical protein n=1 Tax=Okeania sp. KiyG1 TaxID=2720165 RepID=UPI001925092E|nr:hypothetical protein [Okeania sp. KiyG1]
MPNTRTSTAIDKNFSGKGYIWNAIALTKSEVRSQKSEVIFVISNPVGLHIESDYVISVYNFLNYSNIRHLFHG